MISNKNKYIKIYKIKINRILIFLLLNSFTKKY